MVPYSFASTSHFILTFSLSFTVVLWATLLGIAFIQAQVFVVLACSYIKDAFLLH